MPSSTSSSEHDYWVKPMPERVAPPTRWGLIAGLAALILVLGVGGWEWTMRAAGLHAGDMGDTDAAWARERRRVDAENPAVVIVGSSRLHFNVDAFCTCAPPVRRAGRA